MNEYQEALLLEIKNFFCQTNDVKFRAGAREHDGDMKDMSELELNKNAIEENIDQFNYLYAARKRILERVAQEQDNFKTFGVHVEGSENAV